MVICFRCPRGVARHWVMMLSNCRQRQDMHRRGDCETRLRPDEQHRSNCQNEKAAFQRKVYKFHHCAPVAPVVGRWRPLLTWLMPRAAPACCGQNLPPCTSTLELLSLRDEYRRRVGDGQHAAILRYEVEDSVCGASPGTSGSSIHNVRVKLRRLWYRWS